MELLDAVGKSELGARWQGKGCPPTILAPLEHFDLEVFLHCWLTDCVLSCSSSSVVDNKGGGGAISQEVNFPIICESWLNEATCLPTRRQHSF